MARDNRANNIVVGAGQFLVTQNNVFRTQIPTTTSSVGTLQIADNVNDSNWNSVGYTTEGTNVTIEPTYGEAMVDQLLDVARLYRTSMRVTANTSFAEASFENLLVALNADSADVAKGPAFGEMVGQAAGSVTAIAAASALFDASVTALGSSTASAGGISSAASAFAGVSTGSTATSDANNIAAVYNINGGALGYTPVERSICIIAAGPTPSTTTKKCDRIYVGFRAFQMDAAAIPIRRDEMTVFPVSFRMLPYEGQGGRDGSALYGRIVDRIYTPATA